MLLGQKIKVYTDNKNLLQKALGYTLDPHWILLPEEFGPGIVWIKGTHNSVPDAILCLDYAPARNTITIG